MDAVPCLAVSVAPGPSAGALTATQHYVPREQACPAATPPTHPGSPRSWHPTAQVVVGPGGGGTRRWRGQAPGRPGLCPCCPSPYPGVPAAARVHVHGVGRTSRRPAGPAQPMHPCCPSPYTTVPTCPRGRTYIRPNAPTGTATGPLPNCWSRSPNPAPAGRHVCMYQGAQREPHRPVGGS